MAAEIGFAQSRLHTDEKYQDNHSDKSNYGMLFTLALRCEALINE